VDNHKEGGNKTGVLKGIVQAQFEVTNRCNLNCSICWRALRDNDPPSKEMSFSAFKAAIDKMSQMFQLQELNTQGLGEPLLCRDILKILEYAKSKGLSVWFVTNGSAINEEMAEKLVRLGIDKIRFSVDSADAGLYEKMKVGSKLDEIKENIKKVGKYKIKLHKDLPVISFNAVITKETFGSLDKLIEMASSLGAREITLIPLVDFKRGGATEENQVVFSDEKFIKHYSSMRIIAKEKGVDLNLGVSLETKDSKYCHYGIYVDVDGFLRPCCNTANFSLGNIFNEDINSLSVRLIEFRSWLDGKNIYCRECNKIIDNNLAKDITSQIKKR